MNKKEYLAPEILVEELLSVVLVIVADELSYVLLDVFVGVFTTVELLPLPLLFPLMIRPLPPL